MGIRFLRKLYFWQTNNYLFTRKFCTQTQAKSLHAKANVNKNFEDQLFNILCDENGQVSQLQLLEHIKESGLRLSDPRLKESMQMMRELRSKAYRETSGLMMDHETFRNVVKANILLIFRALTGDFVLPEFQEFSNVISNIYWECKANTKGQVANYIPQLSRFSSEFWGVSVCSIDGQRQNMGDTDHPFCLQSCSKPLTYALSLNQLGQAVVHQYVGQEPSGVSFNEIKLDSQNKPHNPMINAGAIIITSLVKQHLTLADRFDFVTRQYKAMAGGEYLGFNNAVFLSERETADRNFALGHYMKENKCFPTGTNLTETLDFYFQLCSVDVTCESASVIAATLANGGINPLTGVKVLDSSAVRNTLSLMHSCGMYDYSGQFAFKVGLPAKSGVSGAVILVVPNVMGLCMWSPPLDSTGNSLRGLQFCNSLIEEFSFHNYDNLRHTPKKKDPRRQNVEIQNRQTVGIMYSAFNGDLTAIRRLALQGNDMNVHDYDQRTPLHVACAEGHSNCVKFLVQHCKVQLSPVDRWGRTPLDDAQQFNRTEIVKILEKAIEDNTVSS